MTDSAIPASAHKKTNTLPWLENAWQSPVILKELRGRMRGARAFILLFIYLAILSLVVLTIYLGFIASTNSAGTNTSSVSQGLGKGIFLTIAAFELMMVCFIAPALTSGSISSERERQTYDVLRTTLISARSLVLGKYFSSLSFIIILLVAAFPLEALSSMLGGVAIEEVLISFLILVLSAVFFSAIGLFFSCLMQRTLASTVLAYATSILIVFGIPMIMVFALAVLAGIFSANSTLSNNAVVQFIAYAIGWFLICLNPATAGGATELMLINNQNALYITLPLVNGTNFPVLGPWIIFVIAYGLASLLLLLLSIWVIKKTDR